MSRALEISLNDLGTSYIDLYLIHAPFSLHRTSDFQYVIYDNGTYSIDFSTDLVAIWKVSNKIN